jgi:mannose-1-phosphate guanylyltransferase
VALLAAHGSAPAREATLVVTRRPDGLGNVGVDATGRVVRLRGEAIAAEAGSADFVGVHVIGDDLRGQAPARGCLVGDLYIPALRRGARIQSFEYDGAVLDVGNLRTYLEANLAWLGARLAGGWVHPRASIAPSVRVLSSVVGEGAAVGGDGALERTVVWPGARASAPLAHAIVTPNGIVSVG